MKRKVKRIYCRRCGKRLPTELIERNQFICTKCVYEALNKLKHL